MKDGKLVTGNLEKYIVEGFTQCEENGFKLFGFYPVKNAYFMKDRKQLDLGLNYIQGGIFGVLNDTQCLLFYNIYPLTGSNYDYYVVHL